jgi:hypothetical protein
VPSGSTHQARVAGARRRQSSTHMTTTGERVKQEQGCRRPRSASGAACEGQGRRGTNLAEVTSQTPLPTLPLAHVVGREEPGRATLVRRPAG